MLILTATQRLANFLSAIPLEEWLLDLYRKNLNSRSILSEYHEIILWETIIRDSLPASTLMPLTNTAILARQAWHLLKQWNIPLPTGNSDTALFKKWATQFQKHAGIDKYSAIDQLVQNLPAISVPEKIALRGFIDFNPQQRRLLDALKNKGCTIEYSFPDKKKINTKKYAAPDLDTEITTMARWALQLLSENKKQRIACIVPHLTETRAQIEDIFTKVFGSAESFTFSATKKLSSYPYIQLALNSDNTLDWTGETELFDRWTEILTIFSTLDTPSPETLQMLVDHTLYEPKKGATPIQILTPLEAVGLPFDHTWILGLQDTTWPALPRPNPFIPVHLQRELGMPNASAEHILKFTEKLSAQFCENVIYSYSLHDQENELRPSALLESIPEITDLKLADYTRLDHQLFHSAQLETFIDDYAPAISPEEVIKGGSTLFKDQAACPFRAFAHHRLNATTDQETEIGFSAADRGENVHKVLEYLWNKLRSQENLYNFSEIDLEKLIKKALPHPERFWAIERERLQHLITQWLEIEKKREPFTVLATEKSEAIKVGDLNIRIRIDRIDQLADGSRAIIDYKTGICSEQAWQGERPDEPQVPLYCVTQPVKEAFLAQIRPNALRLKTPKTLPDWNEQIKTWKEVLENLAKQFQQGYAKVDPKDPKKTCEYCDLSMLCRVKLLCSQA